jgi:TRAP-type C4-dicarboxylate transport system permease small subunit
MKLLHGIDVIARHLGRFFGRAAEWTMFGMTLLITADILGRSLLGKSTLVAAELSGYALVAIVCLALAYTQRSGGHIEITLLTRQLPQKMQELLKLATLSLSVAFMIWFTYATCIPVILKYSQHVRSITFLATPMWIPYLLIPIGLGMMTLELLVELMSKLVAVARGSTDTEAKIAEGRQGGW